MPRTKRPTAYGPEYEQLLLRADSTTGQGDFTIQLESPNAAASLKSKVYAYFSALRKEGSRPDLAEMANQLSIRTAGSALVLFRREDSWDARALRDALGLEKGFQELGGSAGIIAPGTPAHSAAIDKLKEIRARKKN